MRQKNKLKTAQKLRELANRVEGRKKHEELDLTRPELIREVGRLADLDQDKHFFNYKEDNNIGLNKKGWREMYFILKHYRKLV